MTGEAMHVLGGREISVPSYRFCSEPKIALQN